MTEILDRVYDDSRGTTLRYDTFAPSGEHARLPAVVSIHGGGWVSGDRVDHHDIGKFFASNGFVAFCPQYRLAPLHPCPAAVEDLHRFMRYIRRHADGLGIDPVRLGVLGNSAGGHLALSVSTRDECEDGVPSRANACVDICGLADLTDPKSRHPQISWDFIHQFMGKPYEGNEADWVYASPLSHVDGDCCPMLIFHGALDDIVWPDQSERLHSALQKAGVPSEVIILPNDGHNFSLGSFQFILDKSLEFFQNALKR